MNPNIFLEKTNLKRGFIRLLIIASLASFSWGAYDGFSPTNWLYGSTDYDDAIGRATFDLLDDKCNKSKLKYIQPVDEPNNILVLVCEAEKTAFCIEIENCNGLENYAKIIGEEKINNEIIVSNLSPGKVEADIQKVKFKRQIDIIKERGLNGLSNFVNLWIFALSIFFLFLLLDGYLKVLRKIRSIQQ